MLQCYNNDENNSADNLKCVFINAFPPLQCITIFETVWVMTWILNEKEKMCENAYLLDYTKTTILINFSKVMTHTVSEIVIRK